jgi:XTP/dITP diphosphohydrolase
MNTTTTWVLASNNTGKISEINDLLSELSVIIKPQNSFNISDVPETASTFVENAITKAIHASKHTQLPALADDSGLVVPCLNGEPGIYSARYANTKNTNDNIIKLIDNIKKLPNRPSIIPAYFYCVIVLINHAADPCPLIVEGRWDGEIILEPKGQNGFGYDPVFYDPITKLTAAEMPLKTKQSLSHRAKALKKLLELIRTEQRHQIFTDNQAII